MFWDCCGAFLLGAAGYGLLEVAFRGFTHWSMLIAGGLSFALIHWQNRRLAGVRLWKRALIGAGIITAIELLFGVVVNVWLGWNVWDYSRRPLHFLGQICPLFSLLWFLLCFPILGLSTLLARRAGRGR